MTSFVSWYAFIRVGQNYDSLECSGLFWFHDIDFLWLTGSFWKQFFVWYWTSLHFVSSRSLFINIHSQSGIFWKHYIDFSVTHWIILVDALFSVISLFWAGIRALIFIGMVLIFPWLSRQALGRAVTRTWLCFSLLIFFAGAKLPPPFFVLDWKAH